MIEYEFKDTFVHHVSTSAKLVFLFLTLSLAFLVQDSLKEIILLPVWIFITLFFWFLAKIDVKKLGKLGIFLAILFLIVIMMEGFLYRYGHLTPLFKVGNLYLLGKNVGEFTLEGFIRGVGVCLRILCVVISIPLFVMTTSPEELAFSLAFFGVPKRLVVVFLVGISFIPTVQRTYNEIINAYKLKGIYREKANVIQKLKKVYFSLPIPLFLSLLAKGITTQISLETRAFGSPRKITPVFPSEKSKVKSFVFYFLFLSFYLLLLFYNFFGELFFPKSF